MTPVVSPITHPLERPLPLGGVNEATIAPVVPGGPCPRYADDAGSQIADTWMSKQI